MQEKKNMQRQMIIMLDLQESMNSRVHKEWRSRNFEWYRAIWIESAELMDHYGWKWWKKQTPDMEQVYLEIIDIWHFGLSMMLQSLQSPASISNTAIEVFSRKTEKMNLLAATETFAAASLKNDGFDLTGFSRLMHAADMTFENLYCGYVGKNVLNFFRQDHGYKEGSYKKIWEGREDNEHLVELIQTLNTNSESFKNDLYKALKLRYMTV